MRFMPHEKAGLIDPQQLIIIIVTYHPVKKNTKIQPHFEVARQLVFKMKL